MKRLLALFAAVAMLCGTVYAQNADIQISYGAYTQMDASNCAEGCPKNNAWGALTAGVNFNVLPKFALGPSYTFSTQGIKGGGTIYYHAFMLNARYTYYKASVFNLYAHVGVGGMVVCQSPEQGDSKTNGHFAYQIVPLGADINISRNAKFFGELGFGAQGLIQLGFRFGI